ncbi:MAG: HAD family hydrolase [Lachnospiraceae bacterium]|nr:HAD family hydrolase [Lachnospiraceae bacterium]
MVKAVVFDLGGTLMEYKGMPLNWEEYYYQGIQNVDRCNDLNLSDEEIREAVRVLKTYNPRNSGRQEEIAPEIIFRDATAGWKTRPEIGKIVEDFFSGMSLEAQVFDHAEQTIRKCKEDGLLVACLTDLPNGMPDALFRKAIPTLEPLLDLYVSSQICGVRKPNKAGPEYIARAFEIDVSEILFVGDEKKDEDTAQNAGCKFEYIGEFLESRLRGGRDAGRA